MQKLTSVTLAILLGFGAMPLLGAPAAPKIGPTGLSCIPSEGHAALDCDITSTSAITSARLYFHSEAFLNDYFLEMRRGTGNHFYAALPSVEPTITKSVVYHIVVTNADGAEASTRPASIPVTSECRPTLTADEARYGANLIPGLTLEGQPPVPQGFKCKDIVSYITASGEMKQGVDCRKEAAVVASAAAAAGHSSTPWIIAGAAALAIGAGAIILSSPGGGGNPPVSPYRGPVKP